MKTGSLALLLLAGVALAVDTNLDETEKQFESEFKKRYGDKASEDAAAAALAQAEKQINEENKRFKEGKATFFENLNANSDIPKDVFEKEKEGYIDVVARSNGYIEVDESEWFTHPELERLYNTTDRQSLPASYSSISLGIVTSVKNQGNCGSCAAFATTAAHESCMLKAGARFNGLDLSEQYLIDCGYNPDKSMNGCNGAYSGSYIDFFATTLKGQSVHEVDYPYLDRYPKLSCPSGKPIYNSGAYVAEPLIDSYCNEDKLMTYVATKGAVVVSIYASDPAFQNYAGGVFDGCTKATSGHAVTVVGYGTEGGIDYWLVKNSWGSWWGQDGYIKIKRGVNMCGIGNRCFTADCAPTTGPLSEPPVVPPPPPIPAKLECDVTARFGALTGSYTLTCGTTSGRITSSVTCTNGICRPRLTGPSNACMYICGELAC